MAIALLDPMVQNPCPEPPELEADLRDNPGEGFMLLTNDYLYVPFNLANEFMITKTI